MVYDQLRGRIEVIVMEDGDVIEETKIREGRVKVSKLRKNVKSVKCVIENAVVEL
jgi:hypothetical protein